MAVLRSAGTPTWITTGGSTTVTTTPALGELIVVVAATSGLAGGTTAVTDNNSGGAGTYNQVDADRTGFSTTGVLTVWVRTALIASATSTIFTAAQVGSSGGGLAVIAVLHPGALLGSAAVRSAGGQSTGAPGNTPAPVLSQLPLALNPIITAVACGTNGGGTSVRTGYTDIAIGGYNTPATGIDICFRNSGEKEGTITWGGSIATAFASMAIELNVQDVKAPGVNYQDPAMLMRALRRAWHRRRSGIFVPDLWTPGGVVA